MVAVLEGVLDGVIVTEMVDVTEDVIVFVRELVTAPVAV